MCELVIKIVGDRIKLGVLFPDRAEAAKKYSFYHKQSVERYFTAIIEVHNEFVNLTLKNTEQKIDYLNLKYNQQEVMRLRMLMRPNAEIFFAHIYKGSSRGLIAIPAKWRSDFIKINYHHFVIFKKMPEV
jgi:hypothetical protein